MRAFTVISGILICGTGAFCYAVYTNPFANVAFLVGVVMALSGICNIISYLVSGRGENRLTDTALVEGLVTLLYGFAVLNNQVTDAMLTMFFGTWLTLCGATRISQSFYVSRFNPKDWSKIMPLACVTTMLGIVLMMPALVITVMPLMIIGGAFITDGLSLLVYSMYMKRNTGDYAKGEIEAKERADARKAAEDMRREQRNQMRKLSKKERELAKEEIRRKELAAEKARKEARQAERDARKDALRAPEDRTIRLKDEEVAAINAAAAAAEADALLAAVEEAEAPDAVSLLQSDLLDAAKSGSEEALKTAVSTQVEEIQMLEAASKPVWRSPTDIPSLRTAPQTEEVHMHEKSDDIVMPKLTAVNLADLENPVLKFDKIELPSFKLDSEGFDAIDRDSILQEIVSTKLPETLVTDYTPINLDELAAEPMEKPYDPKEATRFTQTLNFGWLEKEELMHGRK